MAKPIRATPRLKGEEAENFIKEMIIVDKSKISCTDKKLAEEIRSNSGFFVVH